MPMLAIFAEEAALALASELAPYAAGEAALAASSLLGAEALMGLGAEALGTSAIGGAEALALEALHAGGCGGATAPSRAWQAPADPMGRQSHPPCADPSTTRWARGPKPARPASATQARCPMQCLGAQTVGW